MKAYRIRPGAGIDALESFEKVGRSHMLRVQYDPGKNLVYAGFTLLLLSLDDVSYREISEITGLTENHVGVALTRARKRLGQVMKGTIDELE